MSEDPTNIISIDASNLITSLLLFRVVARTLPPKEIETIIKGASDSIIEQLSNHFDKNMVEKIVRDIAENTKDNIHSMMK